MENELRDFHSVCSILLRYILLIPDTRVLCVAGTGSRCDGPGVRGRALRDPRRTRFRGQCLVSSLSDPHRATQIFNALECGSRESLKANATRVFEKLPITGTCPGKRFGEDAVIKALEAATIAKSPKSPSAMRKQSPKFVLKLPDLEQSKTAVLNSLISACSRRIYDHAIREFIDWYLFRATTGLQQDRIDPLPNRT